MVHTTSRWRACELLGLAVREAAGLDLSVRLVTEVFGVEAEVLLPLGADSCATKLGHGVRVSKPLKTTAIKNARVLDQLGGKSKSLEILPAEGW